MDKILATKGEMETLFTGGGEAYSVTQISAPEAKLGEIYKEGDEITLTGVSKGKGFAGVVRRHGFAGGPRTHGQSDRERAPGSIGSTTTPGRVLKGKRMAGRMGGERVTLKNIKILKVDLEKNILFIKGSVPGNIGSTLWLQKK